MRPDKLELFLLIFRNKSNSYRVQKNQAAVGHPPPPLKSLSRTSSKESLKALRTLTIAAPVKRAESSHRPAMTHDSASQNLAVNSV